MEVGFVKAQSTNLPKIDSVMVAKFFAFNPDFFSAERRNIKTSFSARESYGDDACGYVQLKRDPPMCIVKCKICPEHKVRVKPYTCTLIVDEQEEEVKSVLCHDCPASEGGCKHAVAFLMWCHRRSEEPSCTSVECYWAKPTLSKVGSTIKILKAKELSKIIRTPDTTTRTPTASILDDFTAECKKRKITKCQFLKHDTEYTDRGVSNLSLHYLMCKFNVGNNCSSFLTGIKNICNEVNIQNAEKETRQQNKSKLWYELRYGRITASKCYEVSRCKTPDGALVASILGARAPVTTAMRRGQMLEDNVRKVLERKLGHRIEKCGLFISEDYPMIAGSPDGILSKKTLVEIKCPSSKKTLTNYIKDGTISKKCLAQVQLQMFCAKVNKSLFCVASHQFEQDKIVHIVEVQYDNSFATELLDKAVAFWKANIYPILCESTKI